MEKSTIVVFDDQNRTTRSGTKYTTSQSTGDKIVKKDPSIFGLIQELIACFSKGK
jgi:hypothetical protein